MDVRKSSATIGPDLLCGAVRVLVPCGRSGTKEATGRGGAPGGHTHKTPLTLIATAVPQTVPAVLGGPCGRLWCLLPALDMSYKGSHPCKRSSNLMWTENDLWLRLVATLSSGHEPATRHLNILPVFQGELFVMGHISNNYPLPTTLIEGLPTSEKQCLTSDLQDSIQCSYKGVHQIFQRTQEFGLQTSSQTPAGLFNVDTTKDVNKILTC
uniref:Uncharacterized protein n=1 Tax=Timema tahoe TaxID=61484 RepID=A0A7R9IDA2_9NEOP|nr:unnamed protein product [Timema tahoe]